MGIRARGGYVKQRSEGCKGVAVAWQSAVFEVIDMRSFSNLWFWIALAVMWSTASHWVLGVPFDMVTRAARRGGQAQADLEDLVRINIDRILFFAGSAGAWLVGVTSFLLTMLALLGFVYDIEFAQAVFCLFLPMSLVWAKGLRTARRIRAEALTGAALRRRLKGQRIFTQAVGMVAIFVTAMWGMYRNLAYLPLGD
jgi:hypothetical protein